MNDRVRIWCLRHAESENSTNPTLTSPLTPHGHQQADDAARSLAAEPVARVYSSTALRARQTAEHLVATHRGCNTVAMSELVEVDIGSREGPDNSQTGHHVTDGLRGWIVDETLQLPIFDGETGETGQQVVDRMTAAFEKIIRMHPGETVALVGHVASLTVALSRMCGLGVVIWGRPLPHAYPFLVEWNGHTWHCSSWPHLHQPTQL